MNSWTRPRSTTASRASDISPAEVLKTANNHHYDDYLQFSAQGGGGVEAHLEGLVQDALGGHVEGGAGAARCLHPLHRPPSVRVLGPAAPD